MRVVNLHARSNAWFLIVCACFWFSCAKTEETQLSPAAVPDVALSYDLARAADIGLSANYQGEEIFYCRKCGAILFRGAKFMPGTPEFDRLDAIRKEPRLGEEGRVYDFIAPSQSNTVHSVALFSAPEPRALEVERSRKGSSLASYFPTFTWRNTRCASCGQHTGWVFQRQDKDSAMEKARAAASELISDGKVDHERDQGSPSPSAGRSPGSSRASGTLSRVKAPGGTKLSARSVTYATANENKVLRRLQGACLSLPQGWWTYEYCHGRIIR